ncbi:MAG: hypothetical protein M1358_14435 [Chloroflexi bacterium]|nr:hypothetical protein [Chloroflexota bacterium]
MKAEIQEILPRNGNKTYGLMELVDGPLQVVEREPDDTVMAFPYAFSLEALVFMATVFLLLILSFLGNAPLEELANSDVTPNPAKAPWYFLNLQELLLHMHPMFAGVIIPGIVILGLILLPYVDGSLEGVGIWFTSYRGKMITIFSTIATFIIIPVTLLLEQSVAFAKRFASLDPLLINGAVPAAIMFGELAILYLIVRRLFRGTRHEGMMALFTAVMVTWVILTLLGTLFRGPGMQFFWPWAMPPRQAH